jgi:predicted dehydrogenase
MLIEKPLATSLAAAQRIARAVSASGVRAMVAHTLRFDSTVQTLRAQLPEIAPVHALYLSHRFEPARLAWLDRAESGGGIVLHIGVHSFDLLRSLSGCEVTRVWCRTARLITRETEDSFALSCQLSNPSLGAMVMGSRAVGGRGSERVSLSVPAPVPTVRETLRAFVGALREGTDFPISIEDGMRAVAIVDAAYRSADRGGEGARVAGVS